jgi:3-hydroxybutyryl-CoA dehydratase
MRGVSTVKTFQAPFFEDFIVGEDLMTHGRTISRADVVNFAGVSGDFDALHLDTEYGKTTVFGQNLVHGLCVLAVASGLVGATGIYGNIMAFYSMDKWDFRTPLFFDDTVRVKVRVQSKKEGSKADRGIVCLGLEVMNQRDEVLQQGTWNILVRKKGTE